MNVNRVRVIDSHTPSQLVCHPSLLNLFSSMLRSHETHFFLEFKSIMPRPFNKHQKNKVITVLQFKSSGSSTRTEARNNTETTFNYSTR